MIERRTSRGFMSWVSANREIDLWKYIWTKVASSQQKSETKSQPFRPDLASQIASRQSWPSEEHVARQYPKQSIVREAAPELLKRVVG